MITFSKISTLLMPELILLFGALFMLFIGVVFRLSLSANLTKVFTLIFAASLLSLCLFSTGTESTDLFNKNLKIDTFTQVFKALVLICSMCVTMISCSCNSANYNEGIKHFEYFILILLSTLGMMILISASDLISMYLGLEVASLSLYIMVAINRDELASSEAALKYFVLGSMASCLLLFGMSYLYGLTGSTNFTVIHHELTLPQPIIAYSAAVFVLCALFFKLSFVPFHFWTPDVYQGAPTSVVAMLATSSKVSMVAVLIKILYGPLSHLMSINKQIMLYVSIATMIVGALSALRQINIKRLLAFSSVSNMGYIMLALCAYNNDAVRSVITYIVIYAISVVAIFGCLLTIRQNGRVVKELDDLKGLSEEMPVLAFILSILLFSMAGIPPLAGFLAKLMVLSVALKAGLYIPVVIAIITSVIGAYYYLNIIKKMYFESRLDNKTNIFDYYIASPNIIMMGLGLIVAVSMLLYPTFLMRIAQTAMTSF